MFINNASIHKANEIQPLLMVLHDQGVKLYFLPPYSSEPNRIARLWHPIKHSWMEVKHRDAQTLEEDLGEILNNFGTTYKMAFSDERLVVDDL